MLEQQLEIILCKIILILVENHIYKRYYYYKMTSHLSLTALMLDNLVTGRSCESYCVLFSKADVLPFLLHCLTIFGFSHSFYL